ncbi:MAG: hypothetical protein ABFD16_14885 [Thermoguttaceae bacterium]
MWGFIRRTTIPSLLLLGGIAAVVYGTAYRVIPVSEEQEVEKTIVIPSPFGMPGFNDSMAGPGAEGQPQESDNPFASEFTQKVKQTIVVTHKEPEPRLIHEVTFGGVIRLASGELRRTYTGDPPSLCPS